MQISFVIEIDKNIFLFIKLQILYLNDGCYFKTLVMYPNY